MIAGLTARATAPVLVVTGKADRAFALCEEIGVWLGEPARVVPFPEADTIPYERVAPDHEAAEERLPPPCASMTAPPDSPLVLVAPALAVAQCTIAPGRLTGASLAVRTGDRLPMRVLLATLERLGYTLEPLVEEPGQAARRGGVVDLFPPGADLPYRMELLGDRVDSLRPFDPGHAALGTPVPELVIAPAREAQIDPTLVRDLRARLDFGARAARATAPLRGRNRPAHRRRPHRPWLLRPLPRHSDHPRPPAAGRPAGARRAGRPRDLAGRARRPGRGGPRRAGGRRPHPSRPAAYRTWAAPACSRADLRPARWNCAAGRWRRTTRTPRRPTRAWTRPARRATRCPSGSPPATAAGYGRC
ncbi:MAG: hypothetical protein U0531_00950 [Dehalococcoidia bacterium]